MRILVIEDEEAIAGLLQQGLEDAGYSVTVAHDGTLGLQRALEGSFHLILLDLMLPGRSGLEVCNELRSRRSPTPILMLTARDTVEDKLRGFELGADDYVPKPFDFRELLARVRALLRRDRLHRARVIKIADLEIDTAAYRVTRAGQELALSHREYELLEALASHEGQVFTREAILDRVWRSDPTSSNIVDVFIKSLRKKVDAGHDLKLIQTVWGVGYTLRGPE